MGNISNVRAYFQREYRDAAGVWHKEDVKEMGQFKAAEYGKKYYYDYTFVPEDLTHFHGYVILKRENYSPYGKSFPANAKYTPSGAYFPNKFYPFSEILDDDDFDYMRKFLVSGFNLYPTKEYNTYATFKSKRIIFKTLKNWYVFPIIDLSFRQMSSFNTRTTNLQFSLVACKYPPEDIIYLDETKKFGHKVSDGVYAEMKPGYQYEDGAEFYMGPVNFAVMCGLVDATLQKALLIYNNSVSNFKRIKFYPVLGESNSFSYDESKEKYYSNFSVKNYKIDITNSRENKMFSLCFDTSNVEGVSGRCVNSGLVGSLSDLITEYIYDPPEKAPDDIIPGIKDDPNEEDSGFQPIDPDIDDDESDRGGDGNHDDSSDIISIPSLPSIDASGVGLVTIWNPSSSQLESLGSKLWEPSAWDAIKQYFTNPLEAILGLSIIPVAPSFSSVSSIHLGGYDTQITSNIVGSDYVDVDLGSIPINRYYGSYLDYDGFTKISCYLPYIGEVDINPDQVMKRTLGLKYRINVITGDCVAILSINDSVFATYSGNCARQIPISQSDFSSIIQSSVSMISTIASAVATGGVSSAVAAKAGEEAFKDIANAKAVANNTNTATSLVADVLGMKLSYKHASQLGLGAAQLAPQTPFLTITRPNLDLPNSYKSFVGYPSNMNLHLGKCSGFTQVEATNLSVPSATQEELTEIIALLLSGVIF